jgi:Zn-dependent peptidase ImmA (M78 family)
MAIRRRRIEALIEKLLAAHRIRHAPVPVERIARHEGARIFYRYLEDDISGFLYRDNNQAVIGINTHHSPARRNFTAAHELGHFLLHDQEQLHVDNGFRVRLRDDVSSQGTNEDEQEANFFAASLLMPRRFLEEDMESIDYVDALDDDCISDLARRYGVSTQALVNRLKNLRYIPD